MKSIHPQWKERLEETPAYPDFLEKVLVEETPKQAIDLISRLLDFEP